MMTKFLITIIWVVMVGVALVVPRPGWAFYCGNVLISEGDKLTKLEACDTKQTGFDNYTVQQYGVDYNIKSDTHGNIQRIEQEIR